MIRALALMLALALPGVGQAQDLTALARLDVGQSAVRDTRSGPEVDLFLSQPVPWRAFTLTDPARLVLDFREVDWRGASAETLLQGRAGASDLRFGTLRPGWSRLVLDLTGPYAIDTAGMRVSEVDGTAHLTVALQRVNDAEFAAASGAPPEGPEWAALTLADPTLPAPDPAEPGILTVVVDPGHGGIDPGAERDGLQEADLMLRLGLDLAEAINRSGTMRAILTRTDDSFVPLEARMTVARQARADVLISLHADALETDAAQGASVYTLTEEALDRASARMAERHDRGDLLAGLDLSGQDDTVATVLMDLARLETAPRTDRLATALVSGLRQSGATLNSRPRREAMLAVLTAADFPSVLIEAGFLSNVDDRAALTLPEGRARIVSGIVAALQSWAAEEQARAALIRQ
ncbi:N-acetylmuramoyl-L-alanine amidase [Marivivens marinus]|uniref:N-acetylmuramoyl-L-alanine amidase n=1 Tax=Marivivens marinus TaxID=3110173 RepID=UPI003B8463AF